MSKFPVGSKVRLNKSGEKSSAAKAGATGTVMLPTDPRMQQYVVNLYGEWVYVYWDDTPDRNGQGHGGYYEHVFDLVEEEKSMFEVGKKYISRLTYSTAECLFVKDDVVVLEITDSTGTYARAMQEQELPYWKPIPETKYFWMNVYPHMICGGYADEEAAKRWASSDCIRQQRFEYTV